MGYKNGVLTALLKDKYALACSSSEEGLQLTLSVNDSHGDGTDVLA